jgi:hypothetical protein
MLAIIQSPVKTDFREGLLTNGGGFQSVDFGDWWVNDRTETLTPQV